MPGPTRSPPPPHRQNQEPDQPHEESNFRQREWVQVGGILFLEENKYDPRQGRTETDYTFVRDGKIEKKSSSDRIYTYRELCRLIEGAGFSNCTGYGSFSLDAFKLGSPALFLVATKA